ncbi:MAG: hypothetical protein EP330_25960 [Deltaproteobacteria bacterium]|nr:MAG: hypothetical protein EP330_25960 [Deltaproteobacteria bacterium]
MRLTVLLALLVACDRPCDGDDALMSCLEPTQTPEYYVEQANKYFNTMDTEQDMEDGPDYSDLVARWEWPPWLKLTAYTEENILSADALLRLYPSTVPDRDCRYFDTQPFARCRVVFYYEDASHEGRGCPIYEEFVFNDAGEMTWIEAWSDLPGLLPMADEDTWAEGDDVTRLSGRIPGLGNAEGRIDLNGEAMNAAAAEDADVADFQERANDWYDTWIAEVNDRPDDFWAQGCGW